MRHSGWGIASIVLAALSLGALFLSLVARPGGRNAPGPWMMMARLIGLSMIGCPVVGLALGIVGVCIKGRKRVLAVIGLTLNGLILLLLLGALLVVYSMIR